MQGLANKKNAVFEICQKYAGVEPTISWNDDDPRRPHYDGNSSYFINARKLSLIPDDLAQLSRSTAVIRSQSANVNYGSKKKKEIRPRKSTMSKRYEEHYGLNSKTVSDVKLLRRDDTTLHA